MHVCIGVSESFFKFWILHLSFVAFANTFTGTLVAFANIFTINIYVASAINFDAMVLRPQELFLINQFLGFEIWTASSIEWSTCKLQTDVDAPAGALVLYWPACQLAIS